MRIIIIGAEAAGASAAAKARRMNPEAEIVVYEKSDITSFGACGLPYFVGGFFDDSRIMVARSVDEFRQGGIDVRVGHEVISLALREKTITVRGESSEEIVTDRYDRLLISTGAEAIIPPIENVNLGNVFCLKTLQDGLAVRDAVRDDSVRHVVIIGGGFIGLELVEAVKKHGKDLRVIQVRDRVLPDAFDREISDVVEVTLRNEGVSLHLAETAQALTGVGKVTGLVTDKGSYPADLVVLCAGVRPNTRFLRGSGLKMLDNGALIVDASGRTSAPDVFAAGDCAAVLHRGKKAPAYSPLATTANKLGRVAGENLAGGNAVFPGTLGAAAIRVLSVEAGRVGLTEREAEAEGIPVRTVFVKDKNISPYVPGQADLAVKMVYHAESRVLLGGQAVGGAGAALRMDALSVAIWAEMTVDDLRLMDFVYAPPFSRAWDVLNIAANAAR